MTRPYHPCCITREARECQHLCELTAGHKQASLHLKTRDLLVLDYVSHCMTLHNNACPGLFSISLLISWNL